MERIFVDTSAWYALWAPDDLEHSRAKRLWQSLLDTSAQLVTSEWVFLETIALLAKRKSASLAQETGHHLLKSPALEWLWVDAFALPGIWEEYHLHGKKTNLVDCSSFYFMRHKHLHTAFAFDKHFAQRGFQVLK